MMDQYGNMRSTQYGGHKCRCMMCHRKDAGSNRCRKSYIAVNIGRDESGVVYAAKSKKHSRKLRRVREKRQWMNW